MLKFLYYYFSPRLCLGLSEVAQTFITDRGRTDFSANWSVDFPECFVDLQGVQKRKKSVASHDSL